jgi:hypothetical protein
VKAFPIKAQDKRAPDRAAPAAGPPIARVMLRRSIFASNCGANQRDELVAQVGRRALN